MGRMDKWVIGVKDGGTQMLFISEAVLYEKCRSVIVDCETGEVVADAPGKFPFVNAVQLTDRPSEAAKFCKSEAELAFGGLVHADFKGRYGLDFQILKAKSVDSPDYYRRVARDGRETMEPVWDWSKHE